MKTFKISINIVCIALSAILAIMCFTLADDITFGLLFSFVSVYLLCYLMYFEVFVYNK